VPYKDTHREERVEIIDKSINISRVEFDILAGMVQGHHKSIREIEKFMELSPEASEHHDDHLYVGQSRERTKILIHSFMENAGKFIFLLLTIGAGAWFAGKAGVF